MVYRGIVWTPPPHHFLKGGNEMLITSPGEGESENFKIGSGSAVQGQIFLKEWKRRGD